MPIETTDAPTMAREIAISRSFDAPRELVFKTWTQAEHLAAWWGPQMFKTRITALDVRVGGAFDLVMAGPNGEQYPMRSVYEEVVAPERLAFSFLAEDGHGVVALEGQILVVLSEKDGGTQLDLTASATGLIPQAAFMLAGMQEGWSQSLDRMGAYLRP